MKKNQGKKIRDKERHRDRHLPKRAFISSLSAVLLTVASAAAASVVVPLHQQSK